MTTNPIQAALDALKDQTQLDEDGIRVGVSREALEMVIAALAAIPADQQSKLEKLKDCRFYGWLSDGTYIDSLNDWLFGDNVDQQSSAKDVALGLPSTNSVALGAPYTKDVALPDVRERFEKWAITEEFELGRAEHTDEYFFFPARCAWEGWQAALLTRQAVPEWIVNDNAELGVKIGNQFYFLYKGDNIVYENGLHDDGTPMMWRPVGKREFGECCHPVKFYKDGARLPKRYTDELVFTPGLSFGKPEDGDWRPIAAAPAVQSKEGE